MGLDVSQAQLAQHRETLWRDLPLAYLLVHVVASLLVHQLLTLASVLVPMALWMGIGWLADYTGRVKAGPAMWGLFALVAVSAAVNGVTGFLAHLG